MSDTRFSYIWQYTIDPAHRTDFLAAYSPTGEWAQLFSTDPSYIETILLQDVSDENQYLTIDFWKSKASRDSFRERNSSEFEELDARCEAFTRDERFIGDYLEVIDSDV